VVIGSYRDAQLVQQLPDIVRVHPVHSERHGAAAVIGRQRSEDANSGDAAERVERVCRQRLLVRGHVRHAERVEVIARRGQARRLRGRGHPGLEPLRWRQEGRALHPDHLDHRPAGDERRHGLE